VVTYVNMSLSEWHSARGIEKAEGPDQGLGLELEDRSLPEFCN
jgi:hypothetical protein